MNICKAEASESADPQIYVNINSFMRESKTTETQTGEHSNPSTRARSHPRTRWPIAMHPRPYLKTAPETLCDAALTLHSTVCTRVSRSCTDMECDTTPVSHSVFRHGLNISMVKHTRPPTRRHLGRRLRQFILPTSETVVQENLATARGLPVHDEKSGIKRTAGGDLKPVKESSALAVYKVKLQS